MSGTPMAPGGGGGGTPASGLQSTGGGSDDRRSLITVNDLTYVLEPDLSVAVNITHKKAFFQANDYQSGQTAVCIMNSGADYIDTRRSYLSFAVKVKDTYEGFKRDATFGFFGAHGSALNCIESIVISSRSGNELARCHDVPLLANMMLPLQYTKGWFEDVGSLMGFGSGVWSNNYQVHRGVAENGQRFLIPLYVLSPLFQYGRLFPCGLFSGLRIEIKWNNGINTFMGMDGQKEGGAPPNFSPITSYDIINPYFNLCCVQLSDSIQRALNEQSTNNGLEIVYTDYEKTSYSTGNMFDVCHVEVRKACSRALRAFARIRCMTDLTASVDGYRSEFPCPVTQYQWQLGSLYFPHQPIAAKAGKSLTPEGNPANNDLMFESYFMLLDSMDKIQGTKCAPYLTLRGREPYNRTSNGLLTYSEQTVQSAFDPAKPDFGEDFVDTSSTLYDISYSGKFGSYMADQTTFGVTLERSTMFNLAGVPVNNSRVLVFHAEMVPTTKEFDTSFTPAGTNGQREVVVWLKYVKLARVWLNNLEVEQ